MSGKDIRSFFFGSKPAAQAPAASAAKGKASSKTATAEDPLLVDSDDEEKTTQRKRLKTTKQATVPVATKLAASSPPPASHHPDRGHFQSPEPPRKIVKKDTPTRATRTQEAADESALPALDVKKVMSPAKNLKEIKGGAAEFFGGSLVVETTEPPKAAVVSNTGVKRSADTEATPTKVPRTSAAKAAASKSPAPELKMTTVKSPPSAGSKRKASAATAVKADSPPTPAVSTVQGLCFEGLKIAVTGVFESCSREAVEDMVLSHGGKVSAAVSGKTNYLVAGKVLEDGRPAAESSKYRAAVEKKVQILSEEDFLGRISSHEEAKQRQEESQTSVASLGSGATTQATTLSNNSAPPNPFAYKASSSAVAAPVRTSTYTGSSGFGAGSSSSSSSAARPSAPGAAPSDQLWVDKYRPASSANMIGSTEIVTKLTNWLRRWDAVHLKKTEKVPFSKENPGARAALLSGPPGIGKSTVAALAAKEGGYDVLELNASDTRNKREIEALLSAAVSSQAIGAGGEVVNRKRLVIMDEVDGMGGSDRGGIAELIKVIKTSRIPIICICNDRQSTKIRSLVNHCYDLRVRRPTKQQIATRLVGIAKSEGMNLEQNAAEMLVEQVGNDIRQSLNSMQMWRAKSSSLSYGEMKSGMARIEKDKILRLTPFDACGTILGGSKAPLDDRYNAFFIDYSLTPLLIQHNYIDSAKNGIFKNPQLDDVARMQMLSKAADAVSDSDLAGSAIRGQNMHWELLTTQAVFCVRAGSFVQGFQGMASFPAWLGKYSAQNKRSRLTKEIVHHTALSVGQGFQAIRLDYVPYLRRSLLEAMQRLQAWACEVDEVVAALDAYGLTKEDFMENMRELQFLIEGDKVLTDQFASLDAKVKTALTKAYNSVAHTSQVLVSELAVKGKKGRAGKAAVGDDLDEELLGEEAKEERALLGVDEGEGEGEESGPEDISALVSSKPKRGAGAAAKKAAASAGAGAGTASSSAAGKGRGKGKAAK